MKSNKLLLTKNWKEIEEAKNLGISSADPIKITTNILFWKKDVKRVILDEDRMVMEFNDDTVYEFQYDEKIWKDLEKYFVNKDK